MTLKDRLTENTHSDEREKKYLRKRKPQWLVEQSNIHFIGVQKEKERVVQEEKNIWESSNLKTKIFSFTCITYRGTKLEWRRISHQKPQRLEESRTTFLSTDRKELFTQNSIFRENILRKWGYNKNILRWKKTKRIHCQEICSKELLKEVSSSKKYDTSIKLEFRNERRATDKTVVHLLRFLKCAWKQKAKGV